ncbi:hypothetical protein [Clostridium perfringens]|nr:hypothetical protein [Clostridium perfringens]
MRSDKEVFRNVEEVTEDLKVFNHKMLNITMLMAMLVTVFIFMVL